MSSSIVCGIDGSPDSEAQLAVAAELVDRLAVVAHEKDAELIVVGSRGRGPFKSAFLGSVSNTLVGIVRCPVLIVPRRIAAP
jgi:nucleotide-binding universal stress UspA family protein